jgi:hypothetical protein
MIALTATTAAIPTGFSRRVRWIGIACCALALAFAVVAVAGTRAARSAADNPAPYTEAGQPAKTQALGDLGLPEPPRA